MKKSLWAFLLAVTFTLMAFGAIAWAQEVKKEEAAKAEPAYIGVAKCKICHKSPKRGNQFGQWQKSKHADAYATLAIPEAKEVAKKAGVKGDPQKSGECLKCHTTAYGVDPELIKASFKVEDGVQCEVCHGPGSMYKSMKIMKDREAALKAGMIIPDEKLCVSCHNEKSPTYKEFVFEERVKEILHPIPKEQKPEEQK